MTNREKVIKGLEIHTKPNSRCIGCPYPNNGLCGDQLYMDALTLLKEQKHGHWENDKYGNMICSVCGGLAIQAMTGCLVDRHLASYLSDYCPHCGAEMDKGVTQDG